MTAALKPKGILYTSFKYGTFEGIRNDRYFCDFTEEKTVSERRLKWTMYIPEINNRKDMIKAGVAKVIDIKGFPVSVVKAKDLIAYYHSRRKGIYPYLFPFGRPSK